MNKLKELARKCKSAEEFEAQVVSWLKFYTKAYPQLKRWNKKDLETFYKLVNK